MEQNNKIDITNIPQIILSGELLKYLRWLFFTILFELILVVCLIIALIGNIALCVPILIIMAMIYGISVAWSFLYIHYHHKHVLNYFPEFKLLKLYLWIPIANIGMLWWILLLWIKIREMRFQVEREIKKNDEKNNQ